MARPLVSIPKSVRRGDIFDIRILIAHPMESGQRRDDSGRAIPREIINRFICTYGGEEVFRAEFFPAIAANPFLTFSVRAVETGMIVMTWTDDLGASQFESAEIIVT
ncbi:MAG: thiosulfate oxidation carrier complex protein SoxZ [Alphaproteobacteria bacterium]|nr:thiosulfate oxidation carrier complex protein SoxZ [Alphaproteobacteria bacterium]